MNAEKDEKAYLINLLAEELGRIAHSPFDVEERVANLLEKLGLIEVDESGTIRLTEICKKLMMMEE
ncbi:MAG: hypothetical protein DSY33_04225 [Archaeoglobus sp.]|jgi:Mn-dependent DtxR family transcriptional regulator|nr:MAG: hypothetical protein DSY33_04225 [Archaeoglobus sp.]